MRETNQVSAQKRVAIGGATGMVGGCALRYALEDPAVECATAYRAQEAWPLALQAERGPASRLRGLLRTGGSALGPGRKQCFAWACIPGQ